MRAPLLAALLVLGSGRVGAVECRQKERPEGAVLADGTVAGEKEAMAYFRRAEPTLHRRLASLSGAQRREYASAFFWFQQVGNCRTAQKQSAIEFLKIRFGLKHQIVRECREREYEAGTLMDDGSIAGEKEALEYLEKDELELHRALLGVPAEEARQRFAGAYVWFQRVGNCRTQQKAAAIAAMKAQLLPAPR